jgi:hypothetical protein
LTLAEKISSFCHPLKASQPPLPASFASDFWTRTNWDVGHDQFISPCPVVHFQDEGIFSLPISIVVGAQS